LRLYLNKAIAISERCISLYVIKVQLRPGHKVWFTVCCALCVQCVCNVYRKYTKRD